MSAVVMPLLRRHSVVVVEAAEDGFEVTLITPDGWRYLLGTHEHLGEARTCAHHKAFKVRRCRVQLLGMRALA